MKKHLIIIFVVLLAILLMITLAIFLKNRSLGSQLTQSKELLQKMRIEASELEKAREKIEEENKKFQADAVSYLSINSKLQSEKEKLQKSVEDAQKVIENKESSLQRAKNRLEEIEKDISAKRSKEFEELMREKKKAAKKVAAMTSALKKERALYHYNLGVAYAQAKIYDDAIDEYKKSLAEDPDNADANYNVALIYDMIKGDTEEAVVYYKRYLEIKPNAEDRDEVEAAIGKLK